MGEIKFITTENCSLCEAGFLKVNLLFSNFFTIERIEVKDFDPDYIFRVPLVIYKDKILDEGELSLMKLCINLFKYLIF